MRNLLLSYAALGAVAVGLALAFPACNHQGACPAKADASDSPVDGTKCTVGDQLQCPFDVTFVACDGTQQTIASSCTCNAGVWSCPSNPDCDSGAPPGDDGGDEGSTDDGGGGDGADDSAPGEAGDETGTDGSSDAAGE